MELARGRYGYATAGRAGARRRGRGAARGRARATRPRAPLRRPETRLRCVLYTRIINIFEMSLSYRTSLL